MLTLSTSPLYVIAYVIACKHCQHRSIYTRWHVITVNIGGGGGGDVMEIVVVAANICKRGKIDLYNPTLIKEIVSINTITISIVSNQLTY